MNAGSGSPATLIKIEGTKEADLRCALAIEESNSALLTCAVKNLQHTLNQQSLLIARLRLRSPN